MANRALLLTGSGPESLTVEERPVPAPERGQGLVRLRARRAPGYGRAAPSARAG